MFRLLSQPNLLSKVLLKQWYEGDGRKVPKSWDKNNLPAAAPNLFSSFVFLLSVHPGSKGRGETHPGDRKSWETIQYI